MEKKLTAIDDTEFSYNVQSANVLFHFMNKLDYLKNILRIKKLVPRYCKEDLSYLELPLYDNQKIDSIYILEKCFCDIKISNLNNKSKVTRIVEGQKSKAEYSHIDLYGKYGIAFPKQWALNNWNIQPITYINTNPKINKEYLGLINRLFTKVDLDDDISEYILRSIAYTKPLQGCMDRSEKINGSDKTVTIEKNFSDECEWRYVPLDSGQYRSSIIIYNDFTQQLVKNMNAESEYYNKYPCLNFDYNDIQYIMVPNKDDEQNLITMIDEELNLSKQQKYEIIRRIEIYEDLERNL